MFFNASVGAIFLGIKLVESQRSQLLSNVPVISITGIIYEFLFKCVQFAHQDFTLTLIKLDPLSPYLALPRPLLVCFHPYLVHFHHI